MSEKTRVEDINRNIYDIKNKDEYNFKMQRRKYKNNNNQF